MKRTIVLLLTAAAFMLRLMYLLHSHPFIDEFTTVLAARAILQRGLPVLPSGLFYEHGLLFSYLDAPFVALAGERLRFALVRLPSLIIGTATVPLLYRVGRRWLSHQAGLVASALLAFSPEGMVWGGRARMYAMAQLLVLLLVFLVYERSRGGSGSGLSRSWYRSPVTRYGLHWLVFIVLLATLLTQFGTLILVPPLVVGALVVGWLTRSAGVRPWFFRRSAIVEGLALVAVIGLGVLVKRLGQPLGAAPLGIGERGNLVQELVGTITYQAGLTLDSESAVRFLARQFGVPHHLWLVIVAVIGGLMLLAAWRSTGKSGERRIGDSIGQGGSIAVLFLWLVFGLTVVEMVTLLEAWRRNPRYLVTALPLLYLIVAAGVERFSDLRIANRRSQVAVTIFFVVQAGFLLPDLRIAYLTPEPAYEEAFEYVADHWQTDDILMTMNTSAAALFMEEVGGVSGEAYKFAVQEDARQFLLDAQAQPVDRWLGAPWVGSSTDFNRVLSGHHRTWFVVDTIRLPVYYRGDWLALLRTQMELVWSSDEALVYRTRTDRVPIPEKPQVRLDANFGDLVSLDGFTSSHSRDHSSLQLTLFWTTLAEMDIDYTIFVHVRDAENSTVAQWDGQPLDGVYPTSQWRTGERVMTPLEVVLPDSLPAGEYWLYIGLYQLETLVRLPLSSDVSGENAVIVGPIAMAE